jgi:uncharacterized protein YjbI with pentapeptide repeats
MKIEIKNTDGIIIFSHECEENTIKKTLELAVRDGETLYKADLIGAYLSGAKLSEANLVGANLIRANLSDADLREACLAGANLSGADLRRVNFSEANLSEANLSGADLSGIIGNMKQLWSMQLERWPVTWTKELLQIGCKLYSLEEWRNFTDEEIDRMDKNALSWWIKWKEHIFKTIEMTHI